MITTDEYRERIDNCLRSNQLLGSMSQDEGRAIVEKLKSPDNDIELYQYRRCNVFSFNDFLKMQKQMQMFGSMGNLLGMLPGLNISKDDRDKISHEGEKQFKKMEVFIQSMTPEERSNPQLMNSSRKKRIADGSGIPLHDINIYIKQFDQMRAMMKGMNQMKGMFGKMGGMGLQKMMQSMSKFR